MKTRARNDPDAAVKRYYDGVPPEWKAGALYMVAGLFFTAVVVVTNHTRATGVEDRLAGVGNELLRVQNELESVKDELTKVEQELVRLKKTLIDTQP